ncbi:MAG: 4Fe-4S dicluster domain-containing protein [Pseudomonadota bacterium]
MALTRREFLGALGSAGAASLMTGTKTFADENVEFSGVLVDTTRCIGCRKCELACATVNGNPIPDIEDKSVFESPRTTSTKSWTVVNRYETEKGAIFVKRQCLHCNQPACASACLVKAMLKLKEGPIIWRESKCMGCRYCMISCPFDIPKFEYESPVPKIQKCHFCYTRLEEGKNPACVDACPVEALSFGTRRSLLKAAETRINSNPDRYHDHIYGEMEAGGTGWIYLSGVSFERIGFKTDIAQIPYPEYTKGFLYSVPFVFVLLPTFLLGINYLTNRKNGITQDQGETADKAGKEENERGI